MLQCRIRARASSCVAVALAMAAIVVAVPTMGVQRTFVAPSPLGNDVNTASNCGIATPCRSFAAAMMVTSTGGEIVVQDSGGYGPVTIAQSVSIVSPDGVYAGVTVSSGDGISIAGPGIVVKLKGLTVTSQGGARGIVFTQGQQLILENVTVSGMSSKGLVVNGDGIEASISHSRFENIGGDAASIEDGAYAAFDNTVFVGTGNYAVHFTNFVDNVITRGLVSRCQLVRNRVAVTARTGGDLRKVRVTVENSAIQADQFGLTAEGGGTSADNAQLLASANTVTGATARALVAFDGGTIIASRNAVTHSASGLAQVGFGELWTLQDNAVEKNVSDATLLIPKGLR